VALSSVAAHERRERAPETRALERDHQPEHLGAQLTRLTSALGFIWLAILLALTLDFLTRAPTPIP
jgi:hypothetical protein